MDDRDLCRAKKINSNEWVEGYYLHCNPQNKDYILTGDIAYYPVDATHSHLTTPGFEWIEINADTRGNWTGLYDKEQDMIFEGDILDCEDRVVYVKWNKYCGCWDSEFIKYVREQKSNGIETKDWKYRAKVIGNIHDNTLSES